MKTKKIVALGLAVCMVLSLVACGEKVQPTNTDTQNQTKEAEGDAKVEAETAAEIGESVTFPLAEQKEYSVFAMLNGEYDLKDSLTMQKVLDEANISFSYQSVMGADLVEKRNLVLASGEYPDVFMKSGFTTTDMDKYGKQGIFIPLEDLIKQYAPNLSARLDEINGWDYLASGDGHIYSLPEMGRQEGALTTYWINKEWMDTLGLQEPKSIDELYNVLKEFKEKDANGNGDPNDEIPITGTDVVKPDLLLPYFGVCYDYASKTAVIDGQLTYVPTAEVFKEYIAFVSKLYQEGIMDKNVFTQKHEQQGAIGQSGDVLGSFFDAGAFLTVGRDNDDSYIALTPFTEGTYPLRTGVIPGTFVITDKCENPEILVAMMDQFYTEEGGILAWMGIEGETWQLNADGDWEWIVGKGYGDDVASVRSSQTIQGAANHPSVQPEFWYDKMSAKVDPDEVYLNEQRAKISENGAVPLPAMGYSEDDAMTIATLKTDLDAYIDQYVAQVATGKLSLESSWDEYVKTLGSMGADQLTTIYQSAYAQAIAK